MPGPKVETAGDRRDAGDVERYEALRRQALGGESSGWGLGLALLQRRGVVAWARAWPATPSTVPARVPVEVPAGGDELVGVLATMALACVGNR